MSADASNYDLQNVECHSLIRSCKISSRSPSGGMHRSSDARGDCLVGYPTAKFYY